MPKSERSYQYKSAERKWTEAHKRPPTLPERAEIRAEVARKIIDSGNVGNIVWEPRAVPMIGPSQARTGQRAEWWKAIATSEVQAPGRWVTQLEAQAESERLASALDKRTRTKP